MLRVPNLLLYSTLDLKATKLHAQHHEKLIPDPKCLYKKNPFLEAKFLRNKAFGLLLQKKYINAKNAFSFQIKDQYFF